MKLVFFDDFKLGVVKGDAVVDVSSAVSGVPHTSPQDLINRVIADWGQHRAGIAALVNAESGAALSSVQLRPPLPKPYTIVCMAVNYMEDGTRSEPAPINAFLKSPHCIIGPDDTVTLPDIPATIFEFEAEMALVIGKRAERVKPEDAYDFKLGVVKGDAVVDVSSAVSGVPHTSPQDLINRVIADWGQHRAGIAALVNAESGAALSSVQLRPPLPKPYTIVCMAVNYMEDGTRSEPAPINAFLKSPHCIIGPDDTVTLPDIPATIFEFEAEMALVIGKRAERVKPEDAYDYIFGYLNFIDGSARGVLPPGNTFYQMKSRATFAPIGPWVVTADEFTNPLNRQVVLKVNGETKQNYNTSDMAHQIPRIMEWVTSIHPLEPGDIVATGTNHRGLSALMDGDVIDLEVEGLGNLHINFRDDLRRTWLRETRLDRQNQGFDTTTPQISGKYAEGS